jgi:hypothetical protein
MATKQRDAIRERLTAINRDALSPAKAQLRTFAETLYRNGFPQQAAAISKYLLGEHRSLDEAFGLKLPGKRGLKVSPLTKKHAKDVVDMRGHNIPWNHIAERLDVDVGSLRRLFRAHSVQLISAKIRRQIEEDEKKERG